MLSARDIQLEILARAIELTTRYPRLARLLLRPFANAPTLGRRLMVLPRAFMGATAFEIHDVDTKNGRIVIGGVEEIMAGAKIIQLLHATMTEAVGEEMKREALYRMGQELCRWEVTQALEGGQWAPAMLAPLIFSSGVLDEVHSSRRFARFFQQVVAMMSRLITDEGGWGHLDFDFSEFPLKVWLSNSQEARWLGPSEEPVCHFYAGIVSGYASTIAGEDLDATEVECRAAGASRCLFEVERGR